MRMDKHSHFTFIAKDTGRGAKIRWGGMCVLRIFLYIFGYLVMWCSLIKNKLPSNNLHVYCESFSTKQITKRKRGRPPKVPPSGAGAGSSHSNNARKSSRLKLVRKAIAKVKREKKSSSSSSHGNGSHSKPLEKPKCAKCDYVAPSVEKLEQHVKRAHKDDTVYACAVCGYTCAWNREYYRHMKRHFRGPPYECDFEACDYVVDRIQPLLYHRMVRFSSKETVC